MKQFLFTLAVLVVRGVRRLRDHPSGANNRTAHVRLKPLSVQERRHINREAGEPGSYLVVGDSGN
jgi:hypothetical protein